jgi:peroxiredoxin/predicted 2-oxoglutarate/Fe(II)-dependent dioxygenase YbiX
MKSPADRPLLFPGDPAPVFVQRSSGREDYSFSTVGGRYVVLCFFGAASAPGIPEMLAKFRARADLFDDSHAAFFGVSVDPLDEREKRVQESLPGHRFFWDFDLTIGRLYGVIGPETKPGEMVQLARATFILDRGLRVLAALPIEDPATHADKVLAILSAQPRQAGGGVAVQGAPVLILPNVFEKEFCRRLIALFDKDGGHDSGFMRQKDGKTVGIIDHTFKRRRDVVIENEKLRDAIKARLSRRLTPELEKAFNYKPTRVERYLIARYDAGEGGYFRPHRDNTTSGTAHRRFAVTINLNAEDYEGCNLRFPEYDSSEYRASTGGAVVFSCSLLHEATPMIRGTRYAFLPFLYDDAAAKVRAANVEHIADDRLREAVQQSISPVDSAAGS